MEQFQMYPYAFFPMGVPMMPMMDLHREPSPASTVAVETFQRSIGSLVKLACTAEGRSLLQAIIRLQHLDKIQTIFDEFVLDCQTVMLDSHGCHVVRSLIEVLDEPQLEILVSRLNSKLLLNMCTMSQYTRRILQTLFEKYKVSALQPIIDILATDSQYLAATQQGCISLMRVYERCNCDQKAQLIAPLLPHFADLAADPYGNYVVQCVLEHTEPAVAIKYVSEAFSGQMLKMSCNKFASNVLEKIIRMATPQLRRMVLDELVYNPAALQQAAQDGFGNFVIQTLIETSSNPGEFKKICDRLRPVIPSSTYGHKIESRIRSKRFPQLPQNNFRPVRNSSPLAAY